MMRDFSFKYCHYRKEKSPYLRDLKGQYAAAGYEELQLLILTIFAKIPRIMLKVLNLDLLFLNSIIFVCFCLQTSEIMTYSVLQK
jgi:hypothetical protein